MNLRQWQLAIIRLKEAEYWNDDKNSGIFFITQMKNLEWETPINKENFGNGKKYVALKIVMMGMFKKAYH